MQKTAARERAQFPVYKNSPRRRERGSAGRREFFTDILVPFKLPEQFSDHPVGHLLHLRRHD